MPDNGISGWDDEDDFALKSEQDGPPEPTIETITIDLTGRRELTAHTSSMVAEATALAARLRSTDATTKDADDAGRLTNRVREAIRLIKAKYKKIREPLDRAYDDYKRMENDDLRELTASDAAIAPALLAWQVTEKKRVEEANAAILREREERARKEIEAQAAIARQAAAEATSVAERKAFEQQARNIERTDPRTAPVEDATPLEEAHKVAGIATPTRKVAEVVDEDKFYKGIASGKIPRAAVKIDQAWLNKMATQLGNEMKYPGVVVKDKASLSARG